MSRFTTFIDAVRCALCACGYFPAYRVTSCCWQPSREVKEPLPRTIGPAGYGEWGEAWQLRLRVRRFHRSLLRHSVAGLHSEHTRASFHPRNTRVLFRWVYRVLACSHIKIATEDNESAGGDGQEPTRRSNEGQQRARRRRSGKSASFVREARVAGRWLVLYSVRVRYCTSPGLSKRARPSKTATQHPRRAIPLPGRSTRSFTALATLRTRFGANGCVMISYCTNPGLHVVNATIDYRFRTPDSYGSSPHVALRR